MTMSEKDKKLLIILAGIIVLALSYFFIFKNSMETKEELENTNRELSAKYQDYFEKSQKADEYKAETASMKNQIEAILAEYPSNLLYENNIIDVKDYEKVTESFVSQVTIGEAVAMDVNGGSSDSGASDEVTDDMGDEEAVTDDNAGESGSVEQTPSLGYQLYNVPVTVAFRTSYKGMKQFIDKINKSEDKKKIDSFIVSFDNKENKIDGTITFDTYYVYGIDKPYMEPEIPGMGIGTKNIFGTTE